jgi:Glycosyl transferase family 2
LGIWQRYRFRVRRQRYRIRALRKARELHVVSDRTSVIKPDMILLVATLRNERARLPYFLKYYRDLGIGQFLIVDNGSHDGSREYLADQPDVSLWATEASYKSSRYGVDWINALLGRYADGHWIVAVDPDEFFVYPFCDTRPIHALTDWLEGQGIRAFPGMVIDMYPKGRIDAEPYQEGQNPFDIANWFDAGNYVISKNGEYGNLWIQGGPRARKMFADDPFNAPSLNKIPLVRWKKPYVYVSSTHMLLPRGLNLVYDEAGGEKASGALLHAKFISTLPAKVAEELLRNEHYAGGREYHAYAAALKEDPDLWCKWSEKYVNWRQLEILGLMSKGSWA